MRREAHLSPATDADLDVIEPWLCNRSIRRWLDGYPIRDMRDPTTTVSDPIGSGYLARTHKWVVREASCADEPPLGFISAEVYGVGSIGTDGWMVGAPFYAKLLYFVAPGQHSKGIGTSMLHAAIDAPEVCNVIEFRCGIASRNLPSRRVALRAGFRRQPEARDHPRKKRRMLSYVFRRATSDLGSAVLLAMAAVLPLSEPVRTIPFPLSEPEAFARSSTRSCSTG
ncbi:GNAT family N-acetyltransferase [Nocardia sp. NPDC050175]|uniref:GNAT family N-acetyltransferase n=1 Tax=Nocardia sp. NPDC050175 TaxID=3364317 RepID=UPI0037B07240